MPLSIKIKNMEIPGDISKASFLIAYACLMPRSDVLFENILINPRRMGFINTLKKMGASIATENKQIKWKDFEKNTTTFDFIFLESCLLVTFFFVIFFFTILF